MLFRSDTTLERLLAEHVVDAIEAPYAGYWTRGEELNAGYHQLAVRYGVPTSAGSDYHAYPFSPVHLGVEVEAGTLERLRRGSLP